MEGIPVAEANKKLRAMFEICDYESWFSINERMPPLGGRVLCYCHKDSYAVLRWVGDCWIDDTGVERRKDSVTHWMPRPIPPKKKE